MQEIFFGDAAERAGMERGEEGKFELEFFGATGARMGDMEFDNMAFGGGLGPGDPGFGPDSRTDYMPGDPFKDPFATVPWGQGPEAFGNFDSEGQNNFAVTGFYDHEHGVAHSFDEFDDSEGGGFEQFEFFGGGGLGAPQFYTDDGEAYIAPTIGGFGEDFFDFGPDGEEGELQSYGQFDNKGSFGPSVGSLVGGGDHEHGKMDFFSLPPGVELPEAFNVGWGSVDHYSGARFGDEEGFGHESDFGGFTEDETRGEVGSMPGDASSEQQDQFAGESEDSRTNCAPGDTICEQGGGGPQDWDDSRSDCAPGDALCEQGGDNRDVEDFWNISNDDAHSHHGGESFNAFDYFFGGGFAQQKGNDVDLSLIHI